MILEYKGAIIRFLNRKHPKTKMDSILMIFDQISKETLLLSNRNRFYYENYNDIINNFPELELELILEILTEV